MNRGYERAQAGTRAGRGYHVDDAPLAFDRVSSSTEVSLALLIFLHRREITPRMLAISPM